MYNVMDITKDTGVAILVWEARDSALVSLKELGDSGARILKDSRKEDTFYHWLDFYV